LKNADFVTHLSAEMKKYTEKYFKTKNNKIIQNGLDLQYWGKSAKNLTGSYILYVGR